MAALIARVIDLPLVRVPGRRDRGPIERGVERSQRVGEVPHPSLCGAGVDLLLGHLAVLGVHHGLVDQRHVGLEAQAGERRVEDLGDRRVVAIVGADDLDRVAAGVLAAWIAGQLHVLASDGVIAGQAHVVVHLWAGGAAGLREALVTGIEEVGHRRRDERAAASLDDRLAIERCPQRFAEVDVLEGPVLVVDGDVVIAAPGGERDLRRIVLVGELDRRLRRSVELDRVRALEHLIADHRGLTADVEVDAVQVRRWRVGRRVGVSIPVRIAHQRGRFARLVSDARELTRLEIGLDHVGPGRHQVGGAVGRGSMLVQRSDELLRDGSRQRHAQRLKQHCRPRLGEVKDDRVRVRRLDPGDRSPRIARVLRPDERSGSAGAKVGRKVGVGDVGVGTALDGVGDIRGGHRPVDRGAVMDARLDVHGDRPPSVGDTAVGDRRDLRGQVRSQRAGRIGLKDEQRSLGRVLDRIILDEVGLARVEMLEVLARVHGQCPAPLLAQQLLTGGILTGLQRDGGRRRTRPAGAAGAGASTAGATGTRARSTRRDGRDGQDRRSRAHDRPGELRHRCLLELGCHQGARPAPPQREQPSGTQPEAPRRSPCPRRLTTR